MASSREYLDFVLGQLSDVCDVSYRPMMGEYVIYYKGKVIDGVYDNRFLIKSTKSARNLMPDATMECPYDGAKEMILVDRIEDKEFLKTLLNAMYDELPAPKKKR